MSQAVCMWSGPRNLSTAMMRSFGARADCAVLDEPFFAPFLAATGKPHPGRDETLAAHETDPVKAAAMCAGPAPNGRAVYFQKHMPHHMIDGFPLSWAAGAKHFFLLRDPARVIASYIKGRAEFTLDDLGFAPQRRLYDRLAAMTGAPPPIVDSADILAAPEPMLKALCAEIDIDFDPAMLSWEPGPRSEDGAWAPHWYASVERSNGFAAPPNHAPHTPDAYEDMLSVCREDYAALWDNRLTI